MATKATTSVIQGAVIGTMETITGRKVEHFIDVKQPDVVGGTLLIKKYLHVNGKFTEDTTGYYQLVYFNNALWDPRDSISPTLDLSFTVSGWKLSADGELKISGTDPVNPSITELTYYKRTQEEDPTSTDYTVKNDNEIITGSWSFTATDYLKIPQGISAERPRVPTGGMIRVNTNRPDTNPETNDVEYYDDKVNKWLTISTSPTRISDLDSQTVVRTTEKDGSDNNTISFDVTGDEMVSSGTILTASAKEFSINLTDSLKAGTKAPSINLYAGDNTLGGDAGDIILAPGIVNPSSPGAPGIIQLSGSTFGTGDVFNIHTKSILSLISDSTADISSSNTNITAANSLGISSADQLNLSAKTTNVNTDVLNVSAASEIFTTSPQISVLAKNEYLLSSSTLTLTSTRLKLSAGTSFVVDVGGNVGGTSTNIQVGYNSFLLRSESVNVNSLNLDMNVSDIISIKAADVAINSARSYTAESKLITLNSVNSTDIRSDNIISITAGNALNLSALVSASIVTTSLLVDSKAVSIKSQNSFNLTSGPVNIISTSKLDVTATDLYMSATGAATLTSSSVVTLDTTDLYMSATGAATLTAKTGAIIVPDLLIKSDISVNATVGTFTVSSAGDVNIATTEGSANISLTPDGAGKIVIKDNIGYETKVTNPNDIPNKKYVDDTIGSGVFGPGAKSLKVTKELEGSRFAIGTLPKGAKVTKIELHVTTAWDTGINSISIVNDAGNVLMQPLDNDPNYVDIYTVESIGVYNSTGQIDIVFNSDIHNITGEAYVQVNYTI